MPHCINIKHPRITEYATQTGLSPLALGAKISLWQEQTQSEDIPSLSELGLAPTETSKTSSPMDIQEIRKVMQDNPQLSRIGTPEEYSQYLDTIFPDSKVKGINYHGTEYQQKFEKFDSRLSGTQTKEDLVTKGFWFTYEKDVAEDFGSNVLSVLLNVKNPYHAEVKITDFPHIKTFPDQVESVNKAIEEGHDSAFVDVLENLEYGRGTTELVVFEPDQIHILGSKQDIEGFRKFKGEESPLLNIEGDAPISMDTLTKLRRFMSQSGIALEEVDHLVYNGQKISARGIAKIYKGLIQIQKGQEENVLAEEVFHFMVNYIKNKEEGLYQELENKITQHPIYKETLNLYKDNPLYQIDEEHTDLDKIKEEAIGRLLSRLLSQRDTRKTSKDSFFLDAWKSMIEYIKGVLGIKRNSRIDLESFENVIDRVLEGRGTRELQEYITSLPKTQPRDYLAIDPQTDELESVDIDKNNEYQEQVQKDMRDLANKYELVVGQPTVDNPFGDRHYERKEDKKTYMGLTETLSRAFSSDAKIKSIENRKLGTREAKDIWYERSEGRSIKEGTIQYKGETMTFEQLEERKTKELAISTNAGTWAHGFLQQYVLETLGRTDTQEYKDVTTKMNKAMDELTLLGKPQIQKWFTKEVVKNLIFDRLGINIQSENGLRDLLNSEIYLANDELGIATMADLVVVKPNGNKLFIDLKTGSKFLEVYGNNLMKYALKAGVDRNYLDTKKNMAYLQLTMEVFMDKIAHPESTYEDPVVVHIDKNVAYTQKASTYSVNMVNSLKMIEAWIADTNPDLLEKYRNFPSENGNINLFDISSYTGEKASTYEARVAASNAENKAPKNLRILQDLIEKVNDLIVKSEVSGVDLTPEEKRTVNKYNREIAGLLLYNGQSLGEDIEDLNWIDRWVGDPYMVRKNSFLNYLYKIKNRQLNAYTQDIAKFKNEQIKLVAALQKATPQARGLTGEWKFYGKNNDGLYNFMIEYLDEDKNPPRDVPGYYIRTSKDIEEDYANHKINKAQYDYYQFFQKMKKDIWDSSMKNKINFGGGFIQTKEQILGRGDMGEERAMPRIPISRNEMMYMQGVGSVIKSWTKSIQDIFTAERMSSKQFGVPVKWGGSKKIIMEGLHTFNMEESLLSFYKNMAEKKYMDGVHSVGLALKLELEDRGKNLGGKNKFKNTIGYLEDILYMTVGDKEDEIMRSMGIEVAGTRYSLGRLGEEVSHLTSANSMWFNVPGAFFNTILQGSLSVKEAATNSISALLGADTDSNPKIKTYAKAWAIYQKEKVAKIDLPYALSGDRTKLLNNKVFRFAQMMRYDTKESMSRASSRDLQGTRFRNISEESLYLLQSIGEDSSLYTTMIAGLLDLKIRDGNGNYYKKSGNTWTKLGKTKADEKNASSMWDAYQVDSETGDFTYMGPTRGVTKLGEEVKGLTTEEIERAKRQSQKAYGSYRDTERVALERYILGQWAMKFKKYLPQMIYNLAGKRQEDVSLGQWKKQWDNIDPKTGLPIMEWESMVNEGAYRVLANVTLSILANTLGWKAEFWSKWKWDNLSAQQKHQMILALLNVSSMIAMAAAGAAFFDDKDKNTKFYTRYKRLQDDQFGIWPLDMLNTIKTPYAQTVWLYDELNSAKKFLFDSTIMGERVKAGPNKGEFYGWSRLRHRTPILNIVSQFGMWDWEKSDNIDNILIRGLGMR